MPPNKDASNINSSAAGLICLPPISEEIQLVWTQAAQTSELDGNEHLLQTFSYFPYPSLADIALICLRYGLQMEKVKTWFMAQRLRCGISWSSEEIEETRARVVYHRDQLHFKSLLSFTHAGRPPQEVPSSEQSGLGPCPLANEPTQMKGLKAEPEESSQASLPLSHQKAKESLATLSSRAFPHQSGFWSDLQSSGSSKEQPGKDPDQTCGIHTSWNHSTAVHHSCAQNKPLLVSSLTNNCKEESVSSGVPPPPSMSSSSFQNLANGATATSKPLQPLGCVPQSLLPSEQALSPHVEPPWPQRLRNNSVAGRSVPTEYLSPDMQRQRKTKRKTKEQLAILKSFFLQCQWARREDYHKLEQITGLPRPEIIQWFGDTRYALKHGQLKWFRDNAVSGAPSIQDSVIPTPLSTCSLKDWAKTAPMPTSMLPPDIRPLEKYWATHQQLQEADILKLSQASRLSTQQVLDWFDSRLPEPAEVVVSLDEEEDEEEEELPDDGEEEEEEEEDDDEDVIIEDEED